MFRNISVKKSSTLISTCIRFSSLFCLVFNPFSQSNSASQKISIIFFRKKKVENWRSYFKNNVNIDKIHPVYSHIFFCIWSCLWNYKVLEIIIGNFDSNILQSCWKVIEIYRNLPSLLINFQKALAQKIGEFIQNLGLSTFKKFLKCVQKLFIQYRANSTEFPPDLSKL